MYQSFSKQWNKIAHGLLFTLLALVGPACGSLAFADAPPAPSGSYTGEYTLAPVAIPKESKTDDLVFIPSQANKLPNGGTVYSGYLRAYHLNANGTTGALAWTMGDYSNPPLLLTTLLGKLSNLLTFLSPMLANTLNTLLNAVVNLGLIQALDKLTTGLLQGLSSSLLSPILVPILGYQTTPDVINLVLVTLDRILSLYTNPTPNSANPILILTAGLAGNLIPDPSKSGGLLGGLLGNALNIVNTVVNTLTQGLGALLELVFNLTTGTVSGLLTILGPALANRLILVDNFKSVPNLLTALVESLQALVPGKWNTSIGQPHEAQPKIYKTMVLFTTSEGLLYSVDRKTGSLNWGWMPNALLTGINDDYHDYYNFIKADAMKGQLSVLAVSGATEDSSATDQTGYVFGTAMGGALHYGLQITKAGGLGPTLWTDARSNANATATAYQDYTATSPNAAAPLVFDSNQKVMYVVNNRLVIRPVGSGNPDYDKPLSFTATSSPYVSRDGNLYLGDDQGFIWVSLLSNPAKPGTFTKLSATAIDGSTNGGTTNAIRHLALVPMPDGTYLVAQSDARISVYKRQNNETDWHLAWSSTIGSASTWSSAGVETASTATGASTTDIQPLPTTTSITGKPMVVGGTIFLPVSVDAQNNDCGDKQGSLYLFNVNNGNFPPNKLNGAYDPITQDKLKDNISLGCGPALAPQFTLLNGHIIVEGQSAQPAAGAQPMLTHPTQLNQELVGDWRELIGE